MPTLKITQRAIEAAQRRAVGASQAATLWDTDLKGLGLRINPSGKSSWLVMKYLGAGGRDARKVKHVFGSLDTMPVPEARDKAIALLSSITQGDHLGETRKQDRRKATAINLSGKLADVVETYLQRNREPGRYWIEIERLFKVNVIPVLGATTLLTSITRHDIRALVDAKEDDTPQLARSIFSALRPFFKWCVSRELIPVSPCDGIIPPKVAEARDRVLTDEEIKALWQGTGTLGYPFGPFYRLLLLTAARREEVASMAWSEVDFAQGTWTLPRERTKNSKEHVIHLSPFAIGLLASLPRNGVYVFTTTGTTPISGYSKGKRHLDAAMQSILGDLKPFRVHDLRRTAASGMARLKAPPHIIERILNHVSGVNGGLVGVYQRYEYEEERREAMSLWSNFLQSLVSSDRKSDNMANTTTIEGATA